ncbi:MAG TPA: MASE1 domain-containing protein [Candidatus Dormibacteraeota bacterium]|jgi:signal transduction histidine kinase|nr:MASE1 domain-containing protein [Candidatus Dormibacteraeota bacterium]
MPPSPQPKESFLPTRHLLWRVARLILVYFFVCKLGLRLATVHPSATAVWPGTGIALAAILLLGYEIWPGIFFGAFAVNLTTAGSIVSSLGIASGNTLEAVIGAYLVVRFAGGRNVFNRAEGIFKFFFFACVVATTVSASIGTASLVFTGFGRGVHWESLWFTWWLGNMAGAILVTPCFVLWSSQPAFARTRRRAVLQSMALLSLLIVSAIVFGAFLSPTAQNYPLKFICIPFVVWVAFELRPREAALAVLGFSIIAIGSMLHVARGVSIPNESLLVTQVFLSVVAITGLLVSVAVSERNRNEDKLEKAKIELEERVLDRTRELEEQIVRQKRAEQALRDLSWRLLQAQDDERRRIARELHDSTGQSMAALAMILSKMRNKAESDPEFSNQLNESKQIIRAVSDELRTTSYLLHPPLLDEMGLKASLHWYIEGFKERSNISVNLYMPENLERLPSDLELMVFRVVQECLTNVHRHSGSPSATIHLSNSNEKLTLEIRDQGRGIPADRLVALTGSGLVGVGLRGMQERVKTFGGELEISSDEQGTTVRATIPIHPTVSDV